MGNKSIRIKTTPGGGDKYLKVKLEQDVDQFEILSLKISQKDLYGSFNSDFGVLVGRVIANGGIGVPNAKISIFIPITDEDKMNANISAIYPYTTPRDLNRDNVRYNLLPRVAVNNPFLIGEQYAPLVPVGTFPTKEEVTTNETFMEVFEKYYKFTTVTNTSGDYMIYGVPVGNQTVHMSVDITDIGKYSMTPGTMITQLGYSPNLFTNNGTRVKFSTDLETLPNVETQEIAVEIRPFWGDNTNFEIGITRQDFKVRAQLITSFVVFGSAFTDDFRATWGQNDHSSGDQDAEMWRMNDDAVANTSVATKRIGTIVIDVYTIKPTISNADAIAGNFDPFTDVVKLDTSQYTSYIRNGDFVLLIACNRDKVITNEFGNDEPVEDNNPNGVFTKFRGMFVCRYGDELPLPGYDDIAGDRFDGHTFSGQRWKMKIPQSYAIQFDDGGNTTNWRKEHALFTASTIYSIAKFHDLDYRDDDDNNFKNNLNADPFWNVGVIVTDPVFDADNPSFQFPSTGTTNAGHTAFGGDWMNFSLYFPQNTYFIRNQSADRHGNDSATFNPTTRFYYLDNAQKILATDFNTRNILRGDYHRTKFIEVPREDVINIANNAATLKGFINNITPPFNTNPLIGNYAKKSSVSTGSFFYRGIGTSDCIEFLIANGIVVI